MNRLPDDLTQIAREDLIALRDQIHVEAKKITAQMNTETGRTIEWWHRARVARAHLHAAARRVEAELGRRKHEDLARNKKIAATKFEASRSMAAMRALANEMFVSLVFDEIGAESAGKLMERAQSMAKDDLARKEKNALENNSIGGAE